MRIYIIGQLACILGFDIMKGELDLNCRLPYYNVRVPL